jgi:SAM-dependent methyltransferase
LEPACGSANDYRFLHHYGLARLVCYCGFDLCEKNIDNARELFPETCFQTGNVFEISAPSKSFDFCVVHDLFEHLSLGGLEQAVREICRVTRLGMCLGFFQMDEIPEHIVRPHEDYFWNLLSLSRMKSLFTSHGFASQAIHVGSFLSHHTGSQNTHNPNAYTLILRSLSI